MPITLLSRFRRWHGFCNISMLGWLKFVQSENAKESGCIKKVNQIKSTLIQWGFDQNIACEGICCTWKNLSSLFVFDRAAYKFV